MSVDGDSLDWAAATVWGGRRRTDSPRVQRRLLPTTDPEAEGDVLFLVVEGVSDDSCHYLGDALAHALVEDTDSPPAAALSRALRTACVRLEGQALAPAELMALGASAVLIRGQELLLAQLLPAQVYLSQQGVLRTWPDAPVAAPGRETLRRGQARRWDLEVEHARASLRPGATLLICSSELAVRLRSNQVRGVLAEETAAAAADWLCDHLARGAARFDALVVRQVPSPEGGWQPEREDETNGALDEPDPAGGSDAIPRARREAVGWPGQPQSEPLGGSDLRARAVSLWQSLATWSFWDRGSPPAGGRSQRGSGRRLGSGRSGGPRNQPGRAAIAGVALVALILLLVVIVRGRSDDQPGVAPADAPAPDPTVIVAAEQAVAALAAITDPLQGRRALDEARAKVEALGPAVATREAELRATLVPESTRITGLVRPTPTPPALLSAAVVGRATQFTMITQFDDRFYVLDRPRAVLALTPGQQPEVLLEEGTTKAGQTVGDLTFLVATTDGVVSIDSAGRYWHLDATGTIRSGRLPGSAAWLDPVGFETYGGNLYAVDTAANQLFRWRSAAIGAYSQSPEPWFATPVPPEVATMRDLAIDGDIFGITSAGQIARYRSGQARPFNLRGLDRPLSDPQAIVTGSSLQSLYVADGGNQRIVQFAKDGQFERQFVGISAPGETIRDLWVDEAAGRLYVLVDQRLSGYGLPPEGEGGPSVTLTPVPPATAVPG